VVNDGEEGMVALMRRLAVERYAPTWTTDPDRAARARADGPTAAWMRLERQREAEQVSDVLEATVVSLRPVKRKKEAAS
jgi:hypothetical protein